MTYTLFSLFKLRFENEVSDPADSKTSFSTPIATESLRASKMREGLRSDARGAPRHDLGMIGASIVIFYQFNAFIILAASFSISIL